MPSSRVRVAMPLSNMPGLSSVAPGNAAQKGQKNRKKYQQVRDDLDQRELRHLMRYMVTDHEFDEQKRSEFTSKRGDDYDQIIFAIKNTTYLSSCSTQQIDQILKGIRLYRFTRGDVVCEQGQASHFFFIVRKGGFQVYTRPSEKSSEVVTGLVYMPSSYFGDLTLIQSIPRAMTVICECDEGELWGIDRKTYRDLVKNMTQANLDKNKNFLKNVPLLDMLADAQFTKLSESLEVQQYDAGERIMTEGDVGEDLYIIKSGQAKVTIRGKFIREIYSGSFFGERALLFEEPRSATITAVYPLTALTINRDILESVIGNLQHVLFRNIMEQAIKQSPVFKKFDPEQIDKLIQAVAIRDYPPNTDIFRVEPNHDVRYLMILEGSINIKPIPFAVRSTKSDAKNPYVAAYNLAPGEQPGQVITLRRGQAYGDIYVKDPHMRFSHDVVTSETTKLALLTANAFVMCLGTDQYSTVMESNSKREVMKRMYLFQFIRAIELEKLIEKFRIQSFKAGDYIINYGEQGDAFFIVKEGEVSFILGDGRVVRRGGKSAFFGERALILDEPRTASVMVESSTCECWIIDRKSFSVVLQGSILTHLKERMAMQDIKMKFVDLVPVRNCGRGGYGLVQLVRLKQDILAEQEEAKRKKLRGDADTSDEVSDPKTLKKSKSIEAIRKNASRFALKRLNKEYVVENNMITHTVNEMEIMKNLDHPFVIKQLKTWQNDKFLYFLQELVTGGELTNTIEKMWQMHAGTKQLIHCARFYLASLVVAIEYIHQQQVVYRDLKPENVLIDSYGYIKIIDFGCAKKMTQSRTFTVAGTPHYMAPDVIIGGGYSFPCDIWTLGIMLYDMIVGYLPMGLDAIGGMDSDGCMEDAEESQMKVYQQVLQGKLQFPDDNPDGKINPRSMWEEESDDEELDYDDKSLYVYFKDADAQNLCSKLLSRMSDMRIGCSYRGIKDIKNHGFFERFDWDSLITRQMEPPFVSKEETYQADEWEDDELDDEDSDVRLVTDETKTNYTLIHGVEYPEGWDEGFASIADEC